MPQLGVHRCNETDERAYRAQRASDVEFGCPELARYEKSDIVEISIVVEARNPRLIRGARMGGRRERQHGRNESQANKSVQNHFPSHRCHCHPAGEEGPGRDDRLCTRTIEGLSM